MISLFNTFKQEGTHTARVHYIYYIAESGKRKAESGKRKTESGERKQVQEHEVLLKLRVSEQKSNLFKL